MAEYGGRGAQKHDRTDVNVQPSALFSQSQSVAKSDWRKLNSSGQTFGATTPTARCSGSQKTLNP